MERISSSFATRKTKKQKNSRDFFSEDTVVLHLKVSALLKESKENLEWIKRKVLNCWKTISSHITIGHFAHFLIWEETISHNTTWHPIPSKISLYKEKKSSDYFFSVDKAEEGTRCLHQSRLKRRWRNWGNGRLKSVLRIRVVYPGPRIRFFPSRIPNPW
jgi:hypothetical protein